MAAFRNDPTEWGRLDWTLLKNSPIALYCSREVLEADTSWFRQNAYRVESLRREAYASPDDVLQALGKVLSFPDYFGRNFDALNDCLSDVEIPQEGGLLLVLHDFDRFSASFPPSAQVLLDILADNSRRFLLTGRRFLVLVHSSDPRIAFDPVGATPVSWNPKEWLARNRGV